MRPFGFALLLVAFLLVAITPTGGDKVVKLTDENFAGEVLESDKLWLVEFYAPWCGHCKKLSPILDKLALSIKDTNLRVGKLDANVQKNTSTTYEIKGFPTLLYFKDGYFGKYDGPRTETAMLSFMNKMASPHLSYVHHDSDELFKSSSVVFVLTIPQGLSSEIEKLWVEPFETVAKKLHVHASFFIQHINEASDQPRIAMMESGRPQRRFVTSSAIESDIPITVSALEDFVTTHNRPFISSVDSHNFKKLNSMGRILAVAVVDYKAKATDGLIQVLDNAASQLSISDSDLFVFGHIDGIQWKKFLRQYEATATPSVLLLDLAHEHYYNFPIDTSASPEDLQKALYDTFMSVASNSLEFKEFEKLPIHRRIVKKLRDYYPWSLFCFTPILLLVISIFVAYPDDPKPKKD